MSYLETDFRTMVLNQGSISALVGTRVYPDKLPQNVVLPAIRYAIISPRLRVHPLAGGVSGFETPHIQLDCYAETRTGVMELCDAVVSAIDGLNEFSPIPMGIQVEDESSVYEEEPQTWRKQLDLLILREY